MTSQFIQQSNQNLLWKIINNTPQMISFFEGAAHGEKERWFQQIIKHVYDENSRHPQGLSLRDLNKTAIDLMVELLKQAQMQAQLQKQTQSQQVQMTPIENVHQSTQIINKPSVSNTSSMESQFEMRRKEYENMTKKPVPTPSFTESIKDEAIGDIGSAVSEYMKQRDLDIKPFVSKEPLVSEMSSTKKQPLVIEIEEIDNNFSSKKVKWGENTEHFYRENNESSIATLLEMVGNLSKKIDEQSVLLKSLASKLENNEKHIDSIQ